MNITRSLIIHGWMSENELRFLAEHASKSKLILEVGSYRGRSTRAMADNTKGTIYAIDPWNGKYGKENDRDLARQSYQIDGHRIYEDFKHNLIDHINAGRVIVTPTSFEKFWITRRPDMIFIDACHEYDTVKADIHHALKMTPKFLCGHDYSDHWLGVKKAVDEVFGKGIQTVDSIWYIDL